MLFFFSSSSTFSNFQQQDFISLLSFLLRPRDLHVSRKSFVPPEIGDLAVFPPPTSPFSPPSSLLLSTSSSSLSCSSCRPAGRWVGVDVVEQQHGGWWFHSLTPAAASRRARGSATSPKARKRERQIEMKVRGHHAASSPPCRLCLVSALARRASRRVGAGWAGVGPWRPAGVGGRVSRGVVAAHKLNTTDTRNFLLSMFPTASVGKTY